MAKLRNLDEARRHAREEAAASAAGVVRLKPYALKSTLLYTYVCRSVFSRRRCAPEGGCNFVAGEAPALAVEVLRMHG